MEHLSNYLRIGISGPDRLLPYDFLKYSQRWYEETGHLPADFPGATRGPGKKLQKRLEEEESFKSIFDSERFCTQFYFYSDDLLEEEEDFSGSELVVSDV
ncbi:unnamed protein product, partial [Cylicocyclus nassatus]